jgi:hypothetical protein
VTWIDWPVLRLLVQRLPEIYQLDLHLQCGLLELFLPSHEFYHDLPCQVLPV